MELERDYQAIYFKDLFISILRGWKAIIVAMLIGALLLGGLQFVESLRTKDQAEDLTNEELTQREQVKQVLEDTNMRIETQRTYLSISPLMSIDPNHFYQARLTLYIHTDYKIQPNSVYQNPDSMPSILAAYQQLLTDSEVINDISAATFLPGQYLHELITCTEVNSHPGILIITINAPDEENAQMLLTLLTQIMEDNSDNIAKLTDKHTLSVQTHVPVLSADTNLADMQKAAFQRLTTLQDQKIEWQKLQTSLSLSGDEANPILLAAIGALAGALIVVVFICIRHVSSGYAYSVRTLKNRTGIKVLGCVKAPGKLGVMQRWLNKLEGRCVSEDHLQVMIALLQNYCEKNGKVMLTSSSCSIAAENLLQALEETKVPCVICDCLLDNPQALRTLPECDAVILLEQCGHSRISQIDQAMQIIGDEEIPLLGCVLIDG